MAQLVSSDTIIQFQTCLSLANDFSRHLEANQAFAEFQDQLAIDYPIMAEMLGILWGEMLSARRSATFWEHLSDMERQLTEQMAESHIQLQQNYFRLMDEQ